MEVREYRKEDYEIVSKLLSDIFFIEKVNKEKDDNHIELVGVIDDKVVGYVLLTKIVNFATDEIIGKIDYYCVSEAYRNKGMGKMLIESAINYMQKWDVKYIELTSNKSRIIAREIYKKEGFTIRNSDIFRREME